METCFQAFKSRGFDLETTHLKDLAKLKKLVAFVSIAYGMCVRLGIHYHEQVKEIKVKKHGYKANSFFRHGLNLMREFVKKDTIFEQQAITLFIRWLCKQAELYQTTILVG